MVPPPSLSPLAQPSVVENEKALPVFDERGLDFEVEHVQAAAPDEPVRVVGRAQQRAASDPPEQLRNAALSPPLKLVGRSGERAESAGGLRLDGLGAGLVSGAGLAVEDPASLPRPAGAKLDSAHGCVLAEPGRRSEASPVKSSERMKSSARRTIAGGGVSSGIGVPSGIP